MSVNIKGLEHVIATLRQSGHLPEGSPTDPGFYIDGRYLRPCEAGLAVGDASDSDAHASAGRLPRQARVPPLIKRNTALVALSQSFSGAGMPLAYGIGPLMVVAVTGSASLAGLSVGLFGLSRFLVSYPVGKITDAYGRKPGIQLGLAVALAGALLVPGR